MTDELKRYLNTNRQLIEQDDLKSLHKCCPLRLHKELCILLLESSDMDTSLIYKPGLAAHVNELVQARIPHTEICYFKGESYGGLKGQTLEGAFEYVAVIDGTLFNGKYEYDVPLASGTYLTIIHYCIDDFCTHLRRL